MDTLSLSESKKKAKAEEGIIVYIDEASFRQTPTLYRTWSLKNSQPKIPTKGLRNTQKIFGAISLYCGNFIYKHQEKYFNHVTYLDFLENYVLPNFYKTGHRIYLIQDNAGYHKNSETYSWFKSKRDYIEVTNLPPYSPEFNAVERIWNFTRKNCTHNRYFETKEDLCNALFQNFAEIKNKPEKIMNLLYPFF